MSCAHPQSNGCRDDLKAVLASLHDGAHCSRVIVLGLFHLPTMQHIPELVIERVAVYADTSSLVLLASCNRHLRQCIRRQQRVWQQRYRAQHSLDVDEEMRWLQWHIKTLRPSASIDWFRALCHRRACNANWFKNDPGQLKDVEEVAARSRRRVTVLDRVFFLDPASLNGCHVMEHCQSSIASSTRRYWRTFRPYCSDVVRNITAHGNYPMSDAFLAIAANSATSSTDRGGYVDLLVWPAHRIASMEPRRLSYPNCTYYGIHGRWLLFYTEEVHALDDAEGKTRFVHIMDLATGRSSQFHVDSMPSHAFLQRVTEDAATVLLAFYGAMGVHWPVNWSLWQFSLSQVDGHHPRCLVQGSFNIARLFIDLNIQRLDNDRFIVVHANRNVSEEQEKLNGEILTLAVIATQHDGHARFVDSQPPLWARNIPIIVAKEMPIHNRIVAYSGVAWTVYSLDDGNLLSSVSTHAIAPSIEQLCNVSTADYLYNVAPYIDSIVLHPSKDNRSLLGVDFMRPERTGRRRLAHVFEHYRIDADKSLLVECSARRGTPSAWEVGRRSDGRLMIAICTMHALHIRFGNRWRVMDLSI
ncbi:hypothetical protein SYNPS1DRAFT_28309 [Syncephalis pseudoplumigaleata]|uniref:F-box domain-containing protein n=1 Tax=Syncephalis pseudoplumigaleata TaxID=1712513 RepID=A0A4P9Z0I5_9FUNG|nr:hypothetical protein SYNPS1DRAFT_28309 [Syncephalis pseudoplumigaleata]|eukprot:RKP25973.1 hypothetical protein SYNPS1DRAFT_28309 [Syncephalis pseudoplumigaleata]